MVGTSMGKIYTGIAKTPEDRVIQHNKGRGSKCLLGQLPVVLIWKSDFALEKSDALRIERSIKKLSHSSKSAIVNGLVNVRVKLFTYLEESNILN